MQSVVSTVEKLYLNPEKTARLADLRYVSDRTPGIQRQPWGRGFTYFYPDGSRVTSEQVRSRIKTIGIPPGWSSVWICPDPNGHLQATGRDQKGRKQYRYHAKWRQMRSQIKFHRLLPFGQALPELRQQVQAHMQQRSSHRQRVVATVIRLLDQTLIRVGNPEYAKSNGSYGLTTLRDRHVEISGSHLKFEFRGKSGIKHEIDLSDPQLAKIVKACKEIPGYSLFQYVDAAGERQVVDSGDVNDYLQAIMGEAFTAKDFRTWAGSVTAAETLQTLGVPDSEKVASRHVSAAVKAAAKQLGNRPATCRKYYVHPAIPDAYTEGWLLEFMQAAQPLAQLDRGESQVLALLERTDPLN
ncbi:MAG: DNA topoisomerase IB [Leptolyngbya sp. SIO4C1]|nr:DNA topoisomerase IB [Leptolyngbya sp. SIO4C1]